MENIPLGSDESWLLAKDATDATELALESRVARYESLERACWEASVCGKGYWVGEASNGKASGVSTGRVEEDADMLSESVNH